MKKIFFFVYMLVFLIASSEAWSKNLSHRLGVGYKNQFGDPELNGIAAQYYPYDDLGFSAALGVDTKVDNSKFGFQVKLNRIIFQEEHLNFYMGTGAGLLTTETAGRSESGFELSGFVGGEFFLMGLDSLGFSFESGIGITSISSGVRFRTFADSPIRAGITFYF